MATKKKTHEKKEEIHKKEKKVYTEEEKTIHSLQMSLVGIILLFMFIFLGFVITRPVEETTVFTAPRETTVIETTATPEMREEVDCDLPDYELISNEMYNTYGRKIIIENNQDVAWEFLIIANFTLSNRTKSTVPIQKQEQKKQSATIAAQSRKEIILFPDTNTTFYEDVYTTITIIPEEGDCDIEQFPRSRERTTRQTIKEEETLVIPYTVRKNLWSIFLKRMKENVVVTY